MQQRGMEDLCLFCSVQMPPWGWTRVGLMDEEAGEDSS